MIMTETILMKGNNNQSKITQRSVRKNRKLISVGDLLKEHSNVTINKYGIIEYADGKHISVNSNDDLLYVIEVPLPNGEAPIILKLKSWEPCKNLQGTLNLCFRRKVEYNLVSHATKDNNIMTFMGSVILISEDVKIQDLYKLLIKGVKYPQSLDYLKEVFHFTIREWEEKNGK